MRAVELELPTGATKHVKGCAETGEDDDGDDGDDDNDDGGDFSPTSGPTSDIRIWCTMKP
eukprot:8135779-Pyramimonas_sp.AAC.1